MTTDTAANSVPGEQFEHALACGNTCACAPGRCVVRSTALAMLGILSVTMGAIGVFVPGLPTTVFLIVACWCFARSIPWLEHKLVRVPLFRPFLHAVDGKAGMPVRAKVWSIVLMWLGIGGSVAWLAYSDAPAFVPMVVAISGVVGAYWIIWRVPGEGAVAASCGIGASCPVTFGRGEAVGPGAGRWVELTTAREEAAL